MRISLVEHEADRIIVFIIALILIIVIIENFHFNAVRNFIGAFCAVRIVPTLKSGIVLCSCIDSFLQLIEVFCVRSRIAACCFHLLVGEIKSDDCFAGKSVKHTRRSTAPRKPGDVVAVRMRYDNVLQNIIGTIFFNIFRCCICTACDRAGVYQNIGVARFDINAVSRCLVPQFHKMNG